MPYLIGAVVVALLALAAVPVLASRRRPPRAAPVAPIPTTPTTPTAPAVATAVTSDPPPVPPVANAANVENATPKRTPDDADFEITKPEELERFADVGGMDATKEELRDTLAIVLDKTGIAAAYDIEWNGVLIYGPPGVGKTLLARATAGELGLHFVYVSTADIVSKWIGEAPRKIDTAFAFAARHTPCLLFFDEFDSLASERGDSHHLEYRRLTNQLLESLEKYRETSGLIVMAATNAYDSLDPAVIRPGRFDRHIRVDLPDLAARRAILWVHLRHRPVGDDLNVEELAQLSEGLTGAAIESVVEQAAIETAARATQQHHILPIPQARLLAKLDAAVSDDRS